jgi:predicted nucleic acid-binding protein
MVFVDTSAWFAYFLPVDPNHQRVRSYVASLTEPMATTDYCIDETLTVLSARGEPRRALEAGKAFFHDDIARLQFVTVDQIHRAWILFERRLGAGWSFTDCTSKIVIDDLDISQALALDEHFRQFGNVTVLP